MRFKFIFPILFISFFVLIFFFLNERTKIKRLKIGDTEISVEIAKDEREKEKGLSDRGFLPQDRGMLFIFDKADYYTFTMKDMNFPLDFIWIRENEIVEITENVSPKDYPFGIRPTKKIDKVLEVNAGFVRERNIKVGDEIKLRDEFANFLKSIRSFFERLKNFFE
jgi:uncharacterized membrane protein (UPF0127 family)